MDRHLFGIQLPTLVFLSLESFFIVLTGPIFARLWNWLNQHHLNPSIPMKFALAMFAVAASFGSLALSTHFPNAQGYIAGWWIALMFFLLVVGEMLLSPIGLSMVTQLAPPRLVGMMMGVWFVGIGFGGKFSGILATLASIPKGVTSLSYEEYDYGHAFLIYSLIALVTGIILLLLVPALKRLVEHEEGSLGGNN